MLTTAPFRPGGGADIDRLDPSLAVAALRSNSEHLMRDLSFFGLLAPTNW